jgi:hypothetical protein
MIYIGPFINIVIAWTRLMICAVTGGFRCQEEKRDLMLNYRANNKTVTWITYCEYANQLINIYMKIS